MQPPLQNSRPRNPRDWLRPYGWSRVFGVLLMLALFGGRFVAGGAEISKEYQLKAAFVYNFVKFVEWPAQSFAETNSPIIVGVLGRNPFGGELEKAVKDRRINGREIIVRTVANTREATSVHLLFVPASEDGRTDDLAGSLGTAPVLTVGETDLFTKRDGIITFVLEKEKLRFDINMEPADRAGLKISAQLQKLARTVRRKS